MNKYKIFLFLIIILAAILRFYKLEQAPVALDWDEISMGYNAWALATTGRDEFGNSWPLTIRSFNDYKPPLYTYLLIPSIAIWGRNEFAIRFPSALAGTLTVLVTYFLAKEFVRKTFSEKTALTAALLLAISPWHLQFSRIAFEANLGLLWFVTGIWIFLRSARGKNWLLILSALFFGLGMMSYHSNRVVTPIMILILTILFRNELKNIWRKSRINIGISAMIIMGILFLIGYTFFYQKVGQARFAETNFISTSENQGALEFGRKFLSGYLDHYNLKFWFLNGDGVGRHQAPNFGLLYWWEFPFLIAGFISFISLGRLMTTRKKLIIFIWLLTAPLAAALVKGTPSAVRSLLFLPTFQIFEAIGIIWIIRQIGTMRQIGKILLFAGCLSLIIFEVSDYFHQYYKHGPIEQAGDWQYGYKQMVGKVMAEKDNYKKILITTSYDQPYIYFLWYGNYGPKNWINDGEFNQRFDKFEFKKIDRLNIPFQDNTLIVGTPLEIPSENLKWRIDYPNGQAAFLATEHL